MVLCCIFYCVDIYYFNVLYRKIKVGMLSVVKWYDIIDKIALEMVKWIFLKEKCYIHNIFTTNHK